jgi:hypothetical protein
MPSITQQDVQGSTILKILESLEDRDVIKACTLDIVNKIAQLNIAADHKKYYASQDFYHDLYTFIAYEGLRITLDSPNKKYDEQFAAKIQIITDAEELLESVAQYSEQNLEFAKDLLKNTMLVYRNRCLYFQVPVDETVLRIL